MRIDTTQNIYKSSLKFNLCLVYKVNEVGSLLTVFGYSRINFMYESDEG